MEKENKKEYCSSVNKFWLNRIHYTEDEHLNEYHGIKYDDILISPDKPEEFVSSMKMDFEKSCRLYNPRENPIIIRETCRLIPESVLNKIKPFHLVRCEICHPEEKNIDKINMEKEWIQWAATEPPAEGNESGMSFIFSAKPQRYAIPYSNGKLMAWGEIDAHITGNILFGYEFVIFGSEKPSFDREPVPFTIKLLQE